MADNCSVTIINMQGETVNPTRIVPGTPYRFVVGYDRDIYIFDHWEDANGNIVPMVRDTDAGIDTDEFIYNVEDGAEYTAILKPKDSQQCEVTIVTHGAGPLEIEESNYSYSICGGQVYVVTTANGDIHMSSQTPIQRISEMWGGNRTQGGSCYVGDGVYVTSENTFEFVVGPNRSPYVEMINETVVFTDDEGNTVSEVRSYPKNIIDDTYDGSVFHAQCGGVYMVFKFNV